MNERRFEKRLLCAQLVRVEWTVGPERFRSSEAVLEDISAIGGCVQMDTPIPIGAPMELIIDTENGPPANYRGHACYCAFRDFGYFVGVRFSDTNLWTVATVAPEHLLNLESLSQRAMPMRM